jgi:hypothetical protein
MQFMSQLEGFYNVLYIYMWSNPYSSLQKQIKKGSIMFCICNLTYGCVTRVETVAFRLAEWKDLIAPSSLFLSTYLYLSISVDIRFGEIIGLCLV